MSVVRADVTRKNRSSNEILWSLFCVHSAFDVQHSSHRHVVSMQVARAYCEICSVYASEFAKESIFELRSRPNPNIGEVWICRGDSEPIQTHSSQPDQTESISSFFSFRLRAFFGSDQVQRSAGIANSDVL